MGIYVDQGGTRGKLVHLRLAHGEKKPASNPSAGGYAAWQRTAVT